MLEMLQSFSRFGVQQEDVLAPEHRRDVPVHLPTSMHEIEAVGDPLAALLVRMSGVRVPAPHHIVSVDERQDYCELIDDVTDAGCNVDQRRARPVGDR